MAGIPGCAPRRYTHQEKVALVTEIDRRYRAGEGTLKAIANALGTTDTSYKNWRNAGIEPIPSQDEPRRRKIFSPAERQRFVDQVEKLRAQGLSIIAACRTLGISEKSFRKWKRDSLPSEPMRQVEVKALVPFPQPLASSHAESLTLVAPSGYRLEGLDVDSAAGPLMITAPRSIRIWACPEPVNMRKSFDGLLAEARQRMGRDPLAGDMFLFVARDRKQARVLYWDGTGLVIIAKRLEKGRFNAPWEGDRKKPWCLTPSELSLFLEGSRLVGHFEVSPPPLRLGSQACSNIP